MHTEKHELSPPTLHELAEVLRTPLSTHYKHSTVSVAPCPDLRQPPFHLVTSGLCGDEKVADVGGQPNLFPWPVLSAKYSLLDLAEAMEMREERGSLIGAGAGPFHVVGTNCELMPNIAWAAGLRNVDNRTHYASIDRNTGQPNVKRCPSHDCALMINLYGSQGLPGPVLKITAREPTSIGTSFIQCIRDTLQDAYGGSQIISLGGVFVVKSGPAHYHIMPDFPPEEKLPFQDREQLNGWLTYHDFDMPIVCMSVMHSADPGKKLGLRMEHSHGFAGDGSNAGGHYHYDVSYDTEYEAYFNTAKVLYRIDQPSAS